MLPLAIGRDGARDMNRLKDHLCFAVQFVGLGYVVLWPVSTPAGGGGVFGASLLCARGGAGRLDFVCSLPHPLQLGIGLHVAGALCAVAALLLLVVRGVGRARRRQVAAAVVSAEARPEAAAVPLRQKPRAYRRPMPPPRTLTEPRTHFGLRGVPH